MRTPAILTGIFCLMTGSAQSFTIQGPGVNSSDFRITVFASDLDCPLGMAQLPDGSLLVAVNQGETFYNSTGAIIRLTDTNKDGISDGSGTTLFANLPGSQTALRAAGNLVFVTGAKKPITVLRSGASPADPLTLVGEIIINYPTPDTWEHGHSALSIRKTPGKTDSFDLLFHVGSESNFTASTHGVSLTNNHIAGAVGTLPGDSIYMITITDDGESVTAAGVTQIACGLRNPAGFTFHPATGDLYFQDNGIDGSPDRNEPVSADELNRVTRNNLGGDVEFFGFPSNYTAYRTGTMVGGEGIQPLIAFQPTPDPFTGLESEGANDVAFAPSGFPDGLNTGIFVGFHGKFSFAGTDNEENALVYTDPATGAYFHFIESQQPDVGHLIGLMTTRDSLFVADVASDGNIMNGKGTGVIYQIKSLVNPTPPKLNLQTNRSQINLTWDRGVLQEADELASPWSDQPDAFSPYPVPIVQPRHFYRLRY